MSPQKASRAVIVFRPRARQTPHLFLRCEKPHTGLANDHKNNRWLCSDQRKKIPIVISPNFAHHVDSPQRHVQRGRRHAAPRLHRGGQGEQWRVYKHFGDSNKTVDGLVIRKSPLHLTGARHARYTQEEDTKTRSRRTCWRCERRRSSLPTWPITTFWTISRGASLNYRSMQSLTKKLRTWSKWWRRWWGLWQAHRGEGLLEVEVYYLCYCRRRQPVHCINWFSICPFANFFYFNKIGWISSVLCDFLKISLMFRIYRCHPVYRHFAPVFVKYHCALFLLSSSILTLLSSFLHNCVVVIFHFLDVFSSLF